MATVPRAPLIANPWKRNRGWLNGIHDQGCNDTPTTLLVRNPPIRQRDWPVPPARVRSRELYTWLRENPNLYLNRFPPGASVGMDVPRNLRRYDPERLTEVSSNPNLYLTVVATAPPGQAVGMDVPRSVRFSQRPTLISDNPSLYTNPIPPPQQWDLSTPPARAYPIDLRTWVSQNPNLFTNSQPPPQLWDFPVPPARSFPVDLRNGAEGSTIYIPPPVEQTPFQNPEFPAPAARSVTIELRTWLSFNPNLYANPEPVQNPEFPTPSARRSDITLRTWTYSTTVYMPAPPTAQPMPSVEMPVPRSRTRDIALSTCIGGNPNIYANPIPFNQVNWPTPQGRSHGPEQKIWSVPTNPNLYPPPTPQPGGGQQKLFIGEIQGEMGFNNIMDSSMGGL
jgi:hypothetical protein